MEPRFDNSFQTLPPIFRETVEPTPIRNAKLIAVSESCARLLDFDRAFLQSEQFQKWINGETRLPGDQRMSSRYAGHQFGEWAGQLGDGRAISLGEILNRKGERWEVQTKGSGLTPFSRMGDGKAVIRSSVREFLCSEAVHGLGIPTTRALCLLTGDDPVYRETVERSAVVARVFPSNVRFGHFEYAYHFRHAEALDALIEYARARFYPNAADAADMLDEITMRTAELIAQWMAAGFSHGVMNTDNMSILGITIDYGPFGFMDDMRLGLICNHSDYGGRYAYDQQPLVGLWNLDRLFNCFDKHVPHERLEAILETYFPRFEAKWLELYRRKLGLTQAQAGDKQLVVDTLLLMNRFRLDYTRFFRNLHREDLREFFKLPAGDESVETWLHNFSARVESEGTPVEIRRAAMNAANPKYVLKNYIAQKVIEDVEAGGTAEIARWLRVLETPFDEHPELEAFAGPTPPECKNIEVSCSS